MMWVCERLSLRSLSSPCAANRRAGKFACQGCPGATESEGDMAVQSCAECGTNSARQYVGGLCRKCYDSAKYRRKLTPVATPQGTVFVQQDDVQTDPAPSGHEYHTINLVHVFVARQQAELEQFMAGLTACTDDRARLAYALERC